MAHPLPSGDLVGLPVTASDIAIIDCGVVDYSTALEFQHARVRERGVGNTPDSLMLLEHPPTYTMGIQARPEHLLVTRETLDRMHIGLFHTDRGGDITFHGPGQLVGYPILDLKHRNLDIRTYLYRLENLIIQTLGAFHIAGQRKDGFPGVWIGDRKIAAIGVKINASGISSHGFAVNVSPDLTYFQKIIPCGLRDASVTSMVRETGEAVDMETVKQTVCTFFQEAFSDCNP